MNITVLVGRLTKDVDLRYTPNGKAVANFTLAVNRPFKNANGENEADFILCQVWGKTAENLANYMGKGSQVGVDGRIATRNYDNDQGQRVYVTEVVADNVRFLESKNNQQQGNNNNQHNNPNQQQNTQQQPNAQQQQQQANLNQQPNYGQQPFNQQMQGQGQEVNITDSDLPF